MVCFETGIKLVFVLIGGRSKVKRVVADRIEKWDVIK